MNRREVRNLQEKKIEKLSWRERYQEFLLLLLGVIVGGIFIGLKVAEWILKLR